MTDRLDPGVFRRRGHRALRRMSEQQRAIFWAMRFEEIGYPELAERHSISVEGVQAEFAAALTIFFRTLREPEPWWRRSVHERRWARIVQGIDAAFFASRRPKWR